MCALAGVRRAVLVRRSVRFVPAMVALTSLTLGWPPSCRWTQISRRWVRFVWGRNPLRLASSRCSFGALRMKASSRTTVASSSAWWSGGTPFNLPFRVLIADAIALPIAVAVWTFGPLRHGSPPHWNYFVDQGPEFQPELLPIGTMARTSTWERIGPLMIRMRSSDSRVSGGAFIDNRPSRPIRRVVRLPLRREHDHSGLSCERFVNHSTTHLGNLLSLERESEHA